MDDTGDETEALAATLMMEPGEFARLFGAEWRPVPLFWVGGDVDVLAGPWWVGGDPPQLMLRAEDRGVSVAKPVGFWSGHELGYRPVDPQFVGLADLRAPETAALLRRLVLSRRRGFRWCRYCRRPTPPELRVDEVCMGCASTWDGIVF